MRILLWHLLGLSWGFAVNSCGAEVTEARSWFTILWDLSHRSSPSCSPSI